MQFLKKEPKHGKARTQRNILLQLIGYRQPLPDFYDLECNDAIKGLM